MAADLSDMAILVTFRWEICDFIFCQPIIIRAFLAAFKSKMGWRSRSGRLREQALC